MRASNHRLERLSPWALAAAVAVPRLVLSASTDDFGADGGYYSDIAKNLRDGHGLTTDVSVFHQAFEAFPHPTSVYPLWPLLYGLAAHLGPLAVVGVWLPTALYFAAAALAFRWGRRLAPQPLVAGVPIHGGHLAALMFATTGELGNATSRPYTEGLAFVLLFGLLGRAPALWRRLGLAAGLELGGWLIALFLTRSQLVVVGIAAAGALAIALVRRPREAAPFALGAAIVAGGVWSLYAAWLGTFLPHAGLGTYLRFDQARASELLSPVPVMVQVGSPWERVQDLGQGVIRAFSLDEVRTYYHLHHAAVHALPLAGIALVAGWRRWRVAWRFVGSRAGANAVFANLAALGLTASLHTVHKVYASPWVFGDRQAIPSVVLVIVCLLYLARSRIRLVRVAGLALFAAGAYGNWRQLAINADDALSTTRGPFRPALRAWIADQHDRLGGLTLAVERPEAQRLAWRTDGVGFHWATETTTVDDLGVMVRQLGVRYVVVFDELHNETFGKDPAFAVQWAPLTTFAETGEEGDEEDEVRKGTRLTRVYAPRCSAFPDAPTCLADP